VINVGKAMHAKWFDDFNWNNTDKCHLGRQAYGNYLSSYIRNQKKGLVLNLNGEWGTGKTHFLKQLYTDLSQKNKLPTIYINAWTSDFSKDPLLVIISELLEQMSVLFISDTDIKKDAIKLKTNEILSKLCVFGKRFHNGSLDVLAAYLSSKNEAWDTGLDATALTTVVSHFKFNDTTKQFELDEPKIGRTLKDDYQKQVKAIEDTKNLMAIYANFICDSSEGDNAGKIYVLVDELDRCRPSYSIELLETIKHFFDIPNFVFVIATDTEQLSHSIKAVYGANFGGHEYLSRFFNRTATLPQGNLSGFIKSQVENSNIIESFSKGKIILPRPCPNPTVLQIQEFIIAEIEKIVIMYDISLRKTAQLIAKFESIIIEAYEDIFVVFDFRILLQLLAEYSSDGFQQIYQSRKVSERYPFKPSNETKNNLGWQDYDSDLIGHVIRDKDFSKHYRLDLSETARASCIRYEYNMSWLFITKLTGNENDELKLREAFSADKPNNVGNRDVKIHNDNVLYSYIDLINNVYSRYSLYGVWNKKNYFEKVEISGSLSSN